MTNREIYNQLTDRIQGGDLLANVQAPPQLAGQLSDAYSLITANNSQGGNKSPIAGVNVVGIVMLLGAAYLGWKALA